MPAGTALQVIGGSLIGKAGNWLTKKLTKKAAKSAIVAVGTGVAAEKVVSAGSAGKIDFGALKPFGKSRGLFGGGGGGGRIEAGEMGACPPGYHLNKHQLSDGTEKRSVCVRNRSVNYANGRAARRAGRRLRGTVKMLKKSFTLVTGAAAKGKFIPRKK